MVRFWSARDLALSSAWDFSAVLTARLFEFPDAGVLTRAELAAGLEAALVTGRGSTAGVVTPGAVAVAGLASLMDSMKRQRAWAAQIFHTKKNQATPSCWRNIYVY